MKEADGGKNYDNWYIRLYTKPCPTLAKGQTVCFVCCGKRSKQPNRSNTCARGELSLMRIDVDDNMHKYQ